ncbi:GNAT family N-acetyltransferase [Paenibacillus donghaensis]|uniref:GNAT family N-acetyltransferase n=1 Tax=Paenibacillus donghaensis TaxID=414771 RepID=UPI0018833F1B|nr:GNAT family N-acetyltransferase [Paenibacillus donghaensis]MBE9918258.1 GNAT family N-acetyltransferase [Paenibacillus donghaensis]
MDIKYTSELPTEENIYDLYEDLDWNKFLQLNKERLLTAMKQSWYAIYAYHDDRLIGTGRIVSDGIINAYFCGLGVHPDYRNKGIGSEITRQLAERCQKENLHLQFFCEEGLVPYYEKMNFKVFAVGMRGRED